MKKSFSIIIIIIIVLAATLLLLSTLVFKKYEALSYFRKEIASKEEDLQSQEEYFQKLQNISDKLKENIELVQKIDSALPSNPEIPELLSFVQRSASQSGLILGDINLGLMAAGGNMKKTKVHFTVTGDYPHFRKFLSLIENSSRLIEVGSIYFFYPEQGKLFKFDLKITAYSY
jgi:Tfp pilus assembly protein PilO